MRGRQLLAVAAASACALCGGFAAEAQAPPAAPSPVLGRTVVIGLVSGRVLIGLPARRSAGSARVAAKKGRRFVPLTGVRVIPVGSLLDADRGLVWIASAVGAAGTAQSGVFGGGTFAVTQSSQASNGLTDLQLSGGNANRCPRSGKAIATAVSSRVIRLLRASAHGNFRATGRFSAATVRGTVWDTIDRCDGTLTRVHRGTVIVTDFRRKTQIAVHAGKSYLARA